MLFMITLIAYSVHGRYGKEHSVLFPDVEWGGMTADTSIFVQSALDISQIQQQSQGQWRIFSKLGTFLDLNEHLN